MRDQLPFTELTGLPPQRFVRDFVLTLAREHGFRGRYALDGDARITRSYAHPQQALEVLDGANEGIEIAFFTLETGAFTVCFDLDGGQLDYEIQPVGNGAEELIEALRDTIRRLMARYRLLQGLSRLPAQAACAGPVIPQSAPPQRFAGLR